ncbi:hypothetical protein FRC02_010453 [Tulasnella sp. 418]|nr:hypothetical protein FRC02_010453 [Tulasnella sp. 418]
MVLPDQFQELCSFKVVIPESSFVRRKATGKNKESGKYYYVSNFDILVSFGATELKCFIEWNGKKGNTQRGPIAPIWNDGSINSSRIPRESRLRQQQDYSNNLKGKEPSHKSEANPKQVRHIPPSMTSPDGDFDTKLVISFDLGTTFSAASWILLGDSQDPHIWDVSEYREDLPAKVPTVLYYDRTGKLRAVGSETLDKGIIIDAEEQGWTRVEWLKLLLTPDFLAHQLLRAPKTEMPRNKKPVEIIADFLRYMHNLSLKHFYETMNLDRNSMGDRVIYIFSHPNGWNTSQNPLIREASILAGLVPDSDEGNSRIIFVSEGEASLHWCIDRRLAIRGLEVGSNYIVVDAGGGAINISSFRTVGTAPLAFEESSIPECHLEGSAFVTQAFRNFVQGEDKVLNSGGVVYEIINNINEEKFRGSSFGNPNVVERMVKDFDHEVKHGFRDRRSDTFVRFGGSQDNDSSFGIDGGQLPVRGQEMAGFFEPACSAIVNSVKANVVPNAKTAVVLVGGFTGSEYLFKEIQRRLPGIVLTRAKFVVWPYVN